MKRSMRARLKVRLKNEPWAPGRIESVALSVIAEVDPLDSLGLSKPAGRERLTRLVREIL